MQKTIVTIAALKAPWPEGAGIGSTVAFAGTPPSWAVGKFVAAPENAKADFVYEPPELVAETEARPPPPHEVVLAELAALRADLPAMMETAVAAALVKAKTK